MRYRVFTGLPPAPELEHAAGSHDSAIDMDCDFCVGRLPEPTEEERARLLQELRAHEAEFQTKCVEFTGTSAGRDYD